MLFIYGTLAIAKGNHFHEKLSLCKFSQASENPILSTTNANTISINVDGAVANSSVLELLSTTSIKDAFNAVGRFSNVTIEIR